jgi:hypothetical protein
MCLLQCTATHKQLPVVVVHLLQCTATHKQLPFVVVHLLQCTATHKQLLVVVVHLWHHPAPAHCDMCVVLCRRVLATGVRLCRGRYHVPAAV